MAPKESHVGDQGGGLSGHVARQLRYGVRLVPVYFPLWGKQHLGKDYLDQENGKKGKCWFLCLLLLAEKEICISVKKKLGDPIMDLLVTMWFGSKKWMQSCRWASSYTPVCKNFALAVEYKTDKWYVFITIFHPACYIAGRWFISLTLLMGKNSPLLTQ